MAERRPAAYTGVENLEVMAEAVNYNRFLQATVAAMARDDDHVVDFGAGSGTFAIPMSGAGFRVTCIEPDADLRSRLAEAGLTAWPSLSSLADGSVDYVYTLNVLEHIPDDRQALAEIGRVLRPGGRLLVYVPAFGVLFSSMDRKVGHHRRYRRPGLVAKVEETGLRVGQASYVDSLGFPASLVYRLMDPGTGEINRGSLRVYDRFVFPVSRAIDRLTGRLMGKNLLLTARKPSAGESDLGGWGP